MIKKALRVDGMSCAMCAKTIENTFEDHPHVEVSVNVGAGKVLATYDESKTTLKEIAEQISKAGYTPVLEETPEDSARTKQAMKREVWISVGFSIPLLWAMFGHIAWFDFLYVPGFLMNGFVQLGLSGVVQLYIGKRFYVSAFKSLRKKVLGMDILVVLGTTSAFLYSLYLLYVHTFVEAFAHPEYYFEISALIITMVLIGNYFEHVAKERTTDALVELVNLGAKEARKLIDGKEEMVPIESVVPGDHLVVLANEKIPVDGKVVKGESYIDEAMITGESIPVFKARHDKVIGATINTEERIVIEAEKVGSDTMLSQIISTVEEASSEKLPIQRTADRIASYFVPIVVSIAILNFILHFFILDFQFSASFTRSVAILVISCPCALGLATPTSILVGNGKAAQNHILYKGGEFFELANKIQAIAFDKTGTLTNGEPVVTDFEGDDALLSKIYSIEKESTHPISRALKAYGEKHGATAYDVSKFRTIKGKGIEATVEGKRLLIGSKKLMDSESVNVASYSNQYEAWLEQAKTVNFVAVDGKLEGMYAVRDELKPTSRAVIRAMHERGLTVVMMSGDHEKVARAIASELGIDEVYAEVLPKDKADLIAKLRDKHGVVAMVGDGINDAPALKLADIGIAMGSGTDVAIDSSDVTLMSHDLGLVIKAIEMSKATLRNIHQNFFWAFSYNLVAIPLAATGRLSMVLAAVAMGFSSITVVLNALRLKRTKLPDFRADDLANESSIQSENEGGVESMQVKVKDMHCSHCKATIEKALKDAGFKGVKIDLQNGLVNVKSDDYEAVKNVIESSGYTVE
ncbi:MAG: heavy metal translocating P-type ATPase [Candidatus Izemoplasmataceae bacterium]